MNESHMLTLILSVISGARLSEMYNQTCKAVVMWSVLRETRDRTIRYIIADYNKNIRDKVIVGIFHHQDICESG